MVFGVLRAPPFLFHGEPVAAESLRQKIAARAGWNVIIPDYLQEFTL
jgi:hypothetical protein